MFIPVLANAITDSIRHPERPLAVFGGIALGAYLAITVANLVVKRFSKKSLPIWTNNLLRTLGGLAGGWIVYIYLFGGGGDGIGGPGGASSGTNNNSSNPKTTEAQESRDKDLNKKESSKVILKLRVLTDESARKMMGANYQAKKYYLLSDKPDELCDYESLISNFEGILRNSTIERIDFVIGLEDPDRDTYRVRVVRNWCETKNIPMDFLPR